jgi:hypothetical protein
MRDWLVTRPVTFWGLALFAALLAAALIGHALHLRAQRRAGPESDFASQEGYVMSAVVTLLAFMIGFTYSISLDRFEGRRRPPAVGGPGRTGNPGIIPASANP